jgi:DNA-binding LacI/PurR family transcriptional regulator
VSDGHGNDHGPATITDVARRAHVSITTVSHVFSGKRSVAEGTRRRVLDAAQALRYRPAVAARGLATGRAMALGLQFPMEGESLLLNPFFPALLEGVSAAAVRAGYTFVLLPSRRSGAFPLEMLLDSQGLDAAIIVDPVAGNDVVPVLRKAGLPIVTLGGKLPKGSAPWVDNDHATAIRDVAAHLTERGYGHPALISVAEGPFSYTTEIERAFRELAPPDTHPPVLRAEDTSERAGYTAAIKLLAGRSRPDAIIAAVDRQAIGVLAAVREMGLRVPEDVGVVGEGDTFLARNSTPPLTTVDAQTALLGAAAIDLVRCILDGRRGEPAAQPESVIVPARLVVRESTARRPL